MNNATTNIKTDKQLVPAIRFKEFEGDWNNKQLKEICSFFSGGTPTSSNKEYYTGDIPFIGSGNIFDSNVSNYITEEALNSSSAKIVEVGDLLYALYGANSGEVGISKMSGAINQAILCIRTDSEKIDFIHCLLVLNKDKIVGKYLQGGQGNLSANIVKKLKYHFPSLPEQQKIASFLSEVDEKIQQLTKKKSLLEQYKKGVMQALFSGSLRFKDENGNPYPDWEEKRLGEICDYKNGGAFENLVVDEGEFNLITLNSIDIKGKLKSNHKKVIKSDNSLLEGDLIMVLSDVAHGNFLGLSDIIPDNSYVLNQRMGALKPKVELIRIYLKTFINYNQKYFKLMGQGSSQQNLSKGDILNFKVLFPIIEEQQKIATYISSIDTKIESVNNQITQSQTFKKGLLQQMFV